MKILFTQLLDPSIAEDRKYTILCDLSQEAITTDALYELAMLVKQQQAMHLDAPESIDIVGTGGSGLPRINTSTITSIILSRMGIPVMKHGSNAASGRFGSMDLLNGLQVAIDLDEAAIMQEYRQHKLAFLYAKRFFPIMKQVAGARKRFGKPTIFNLLGPLLSPANPEQQLIGCSFPEHMPTMAEVAQRLGRKNVAVVRGVDGLDEITLCGPTHVVHLHDDTISEYRISPADAGLTPCDFAEIAGGDAAANVAIAKAILEGSCQTKHKELVGLNVAFVLHMLGQAPDLKAAYQLFHDYYETLSGQ